MNAGGFAKWNTACFAKPVLAHAGNLGALAVAHMCMGCMQMPKGDSVWFTVKYHEKRKKSFADCGAAYDDKSYGCVVTMQQRSGSRGRELLSPFLPQQGCCSDVIGAWTLPSNVHDCEARSRVFQGLFKTTDMALLRGNSRGETV